MTLKKIAELSELAAYQHRINLGETKILNALKESIEKDYHVVKQDTLNLDEDFRDIRLSGAILRERKNPTYTWLDSFYEESINRGIIHTLLKHGDKLNQRFNLSEYELPKRDENRTLSYKATPIEDVESLKREELRMIEWSNRFDNEVKNWSEESLETRVQRYLYYKMKLSVLKDEYNWQKQELLSLMKKHQVEATVDGYYLKEEPQKYDFSRLYNVELYEKVKIATNGTKSIDLYSDKKIVEVNIFEDDLEDVNTLPNRYSQKRLKAISDVLGKNFSLIEGYCLERDILKRFPVLTQKVEEAIDNDMLPFSILETGRFIQHQDDLSLSFEIVTEDSYTKRKELFHQKYMERALNKSGYYE